MAADTHQADPLVSVIIPVYNVVDYLAACLESTIDQGLGDGEIEILVIDDGSTDGSAELLDVLSGRIPNVTAIHQPNSGGPGRPRNVGLDLARGRYVFFLDADDELTPNALRDLVFFADEHGSEVLLCKMGGLGGRTPPKSMFVRTVADADLISDRLFRTMGPWKLYRRDLLERLNNRFPTHLRRGEDPPFVMRAYLGATHVSVLADRDYYLIRDREDGTNLTKQPSEPAEALERVLALIAEIANGTEPGALRNGAMMRPIQFNIPPLLGHRFLNVGDDEQARIVSELQGALLPLWNDEVALHAKGALGTKLRIALDGDHRLLSRLIAWERDHSGSTLAPGDAGFILDLPEDLASEIGSERSVAPVAKVEAKLTALSVTGRAVRVGVSLAVPQAAALPPVVLRLQSRLEGEKIDISLDATGAAAAKGCELRAQPDIDLDRLTQGVWDLFLVLCFDQGEISRRLGGKRAKGVGTESLVVPGAAGDQPRALAYFTEGYGNLSLDVGFTMPKHAAPRATLLGVLSDPEGDVCVLGVESPLAVRVEYGPGSESTPLKHSRLSSATLLVRVPGRVDPSAPQLRVVSAAGSVESVSAPELAPTALLGPGDLSATKQPVTRRRRWFGRRG